MMAIWSTDLSLSNSVIFLVFNFSSFTMKVIQSFYYLGHKEVHQGKHTYIKMNLHSQVSVKYFEPLRKRVPLKSCIFYLDHLFFLLLPSVAPLCCLRRLLCWRPQTTTMREESGRAYLPPSGP